MFYYVRPRYNRCLAVSNDFFYLLSKRTHLTLFVYNRYSIISKDRWCTCTVYYTDNKQFRLNRRIPCHLEAIVWSGYVVFKWYFGKWKEKRCLLDCVSVYPCEQVYLKETRGNSLFSQHIRQIKGKPWKFASCYEWGTLLTPHFVGMGNHVSMYLVFSGV